jgi:hypothetical protein
VAIYEQSALRPWGVGSLEFNYGYAGFYKPVPDEILAFAEQEIRPIQKDLTIFARAVYLLDVFEMLMPQFTNVLDALSLASWLCIFRHWDRHSSKSSKAG